MRYSVKACGWSLRGADAPRVSRLLSRRVPAALAMSLASWLVVGCGAGDALPPRAEVGQQGPAAAVPVAVTPTVVKLSTLDRDGYDRFLSQHRGQVVLVDFWATWCAVCVEGLPHTLELQRKYGDRGLVVATVAMDDSESQSAAEALLGKSGGLGPHFISTFGTDPQGMQAFGIERGTIPAIKVFNREGKLDQTFGDGDLIPHAEVERRVAQLLGEEAVRP